MYTYNKNDKSYTFSFDEMDIENMVDIDENNEESNNDNNKNDDTTNPQQDRPKKIEVINGGNELDISPVSEYIEVEKPKTEKKENIVIPEDNK